MAAAMETPAAESFTFQAETKALLGLMINSLYTHKEVFLRELISNASDALDKLRVRSLTDHDVMGEEKTLEVVLRPDEKAGTLTISDTGIGMTKDELIKYLGTIAFSGSREFMEKLTGDKARDAKLIGQFGVGFYSAFLVANDVKVTSRAAGSSEAWTWESTADGKFTVTPAEKATRGTDIVLTLKDDQKEFASGYRLRELVTKYSDFVSHPIRLEQLETQGEGEKQTETKTNETVNQGKALWTRPKAEIPDEQYAEFYKHVSHDWEEPLARTHFTVEGTQLFTGLLFVPKRAPFDLFHREMRSGIKLYVKRVFVMDECDVLLPEWLRFVRGVVDSDDLPLNVSREVLQQDRHVEAIKKQLTKKTLDLLEEMAKEKPADYETFWSQFGVVLKEGLHLDESNKEKLAGLLRFASSTQDKPTSLADYVSRMKPEQQAIYFITGPDRAFLEKSPHIEGLKKKGFEVLFFTDPVDEWVVTALPEFQGKKLVSAMKGELAADAAKTDEEKKEADKDPLLAKMKEALGDKVKDVRTSSRLADSPVCLVSGEHDLGANLERILRQHNPTQAMPFAKRTLEVNGDHPLIKNLRMLVLEGKSDLLVREWTEVLHDQALLTEGSAIKDPVGFAGRLTRLLQDASDRALGK